MKHNLFCTLILDNLHKGNVVSGSKLNGIKVAKITFELLQDGNTLGTTSDWEKLKICCEYQLPGEEQFFTLASERGWSCNSSKNISDIIDILKKRVKEIETDLEDIDIDERVAEKLIRESEELNLSF